MSKDNGNFDFSLIVNNILNRVLSFYKHSNQINHDNPSITLDLVPERWQWETRPCGVSYTVDKDPEIFGIIYILDQLYKLKMKNQ